MGSAETAEKETMDFPVRFSVDYPERLSRGILLLRAFFGWLYVGIPHGVILWLYGMAAGIVQFIAWCMILGTSRYPKGMFDFVVRYTRWSLRVGAYMYCFTDLYPPFSGDENVEGSPVKYSVDYPERLSRGLLLLKTFFGWLYVGIPHGLALLFYAIAVCIVAFIAWWAILFTGRYPKGMFEFVVSFLRWGLRVGAYMSYFTDVYPPFNGEEYRLL